MSVREKDDPDLFARIQERNLLRQYDLLTNRIEIGLKKGIESTSAIIAHRTSAMFQT